MFDPAAVSRDVRRGVIEAAHRSGSPHVASALSCADILTVLYFDYLRLDPWDERDIFILSKAHAAMALYSVLAERGIIGRDLLDGYYRDGGTLPAHLDRCSARGVEVSAGSLGHGFSIGLGMACGFMRRESGRRVVALIGDGESQEGAIWEGALFAPRLGLENFMAIMDCNNLQGYGRPRDLCAFEPMGAKWEAFGWHVLEIDGHDPAAISAALRADSRRKPKMILARTTKGKGVSFMEDELVWHYYRVTDRHREQALKELR